MSWERTVELIERFQDRIERDLDEATLTSLCNAVNSLMNYHRTASQLAIEIQDREALDKTIEKAMEIADHIRAIKRGTV